MTTNIKDAFTELETKTNNLVNSLQNLGPNISAAVDRLEYIDPTLGRHPRLQQKHFEIENVDVETIQIVDRIIENLNQSKVILERFHTMKKRATQHINNQTIGTLEGLARDTIRRHNIQPDNFIAQGVLEQPYDEIAARKRHRVLGGKKRKTYKKRNLNHRSKRR